MAAASATSRLVVELNRSRDREFAMMYATSSGARYELIKVWYRPIRSAPPSISSIWRLFSIKTEMWSPRRIPAARRKCATWLQRASYCANVTTSPVLPMMIAGWSGWSRACWRANMRFPSRARPFLQTLRDDGQQQVGPLVGAAREGRGAAVDVGGAVGRVVVQEDAVAPHRHAVAGRPGTVAGELEVASLDGHRQPVAGRNDDRGGPDLDVERDALAGCERLGPVVRVPGPVGQAALGVGGALRGPQPAHADHPGRVEAADERDVPAAGVQDAQGQEEVGVGGAGRHDEPGRGGPGDLGFLGERLGGERQAIAQGLEVRPGRAGGRRRGQGARAGIQVEPGPPGPGQRPLVFLALLEAAVDQPGVELDRWLAVPAGVLVVQEIAEEPLLQGHAVVGVKLGEVLVAVDLQPLAGRSGARVALEVAPGVQMMGPVGRREHRDGDLLQFGRTLPVELVVERVGQQFGRRVAAVGGEFAGRQDLVPGDRLAGVRVPLTAPAAAKLDRRHLDRVPGG